MPWESSLRRYWSLSACGTLHRKSMRRQGTKAPVFHLLAKKALEKRYARSAQGESVLACACCIAVFAPSHPHRHTRLSQLISVLAQDT
eukprot:1023463-Rhodomonas_salina.3